MTAGYSKVFRRIWSDERFRLLTSPDKLVALYLLTGQSNRIGYFFLSPALAAEALGLPVLDCQEAIQRVCEAMAWGWDDAASVVIIPTWWKWNPPHNQNNLLGYLQDLQEVPRSALLPKFLKGRKWLTISLQDTFTNAVARTLGTEPPTEPPTVSRLSADPKPNPNQAITKPNPNPKPKRRDRAQAQTQAPFSLSQTQTPGQDRADPRIQELCRIFQERTGLSVHAGVCAYLGKLATKYGVAEVAGVLTDHGPRIGGAENALRYLGGMLDVRRREGHRPIGMAPPPPPREPRRVLIPCADANCRGFAKVAPGFTGLAYCDDCRGTDGDAT
jgi:hypothetical protein